MRKLFTLLLLVPVISYSQNKIKFDLGVSYYHNQYLENGIGAHALIGPKLTKDIGLCIGMEAIKFKDVKEAYIPLTLNLLLSPTLNKNTITPTFNIAGGYGIYHYQENRNDPATEGGPYLGVFGGFKINNIGKHSPYFMVGYTSLGFNSTSSSVDGYGNIIRGTGKYHYDAFSLRAGVDF